MNRNLSFLIYPIGAGMGRGPKRWAQVMDILEVTPKPIRSMLASPRSAAFIRGLAKSNKLTQKQAQGVSYAVLQVALGERAVAKLPAILSTDLKLPNDQAQRIAREIETDLLQPIRNELEAWWAGQKKQVKRQSKNTDAGAKNVLNLRDGKQAPPPPPMPSS